MRSEDGSVSSRRLRVQLVAPVRRIVWGALFGAALHEDGRVRVWGWLGPNYLPAELFPKQRFGSFAEPTVVSQISGVADVAAGGLCIVLIGEDRSASLWGPLTLDDRLRPVCIEGIDRVQWARTGYDCTFLRLDDGRVFGLRHGATGGPFGDDPSVPPYQVVEVPELRDVSDIAIGDLHAVALTQDGLVLTWGSNFRGQLGDPSSGRRARPALVPNLANVSAIAATFDTSLALLDDGTVQLWGDPIGISGSLARRPIPVPGLSGVRAIGCTDESGYALLEDGSVFAWGFNDSGELGNGTRIGSSRPVKCGVAGVTRIFAGHPGMHVITASGARYGWGDNFLYSVGNGSRDDQLLPTLIYSR